MSTPANPSNTSLPENPAVAGGSDAVSLQQLMEGDAGAVQVCVEAMRRQGWIFVRLPDEISLQSRVLEKDLLRFFSSESPSMYGRSLKATSYLGHLGYNSDPGRQSLRILTGTELEKQELPDGLAVALRLLSSGVDGALRCVAKALSASMFGADPQDLGRGHGLPLLCGGQEDEAAFALLEAAFYPNETPTKTENCAAHFDPGLFSLNVLSNQPGLEFQDDIGRWVAAPFGDCSLGILWSGWAASEAANEAGLPKVKAGIHRVVHPKELGAPPRLSVWSEVCTREQVFIENVLRMPWNDHNIEFGSPTQLLVPNIVGKPYVVPVKKGGILESLKIVQELKGLPMSKIMRVPVYNDDGEVTGVSSGF